MKPSTYLDRIIALRETRYEKDMYELRILAKDIALLEKENEELRLWKAIAQEALRDAKIDIGSAIFDEDGLDGFVGAHTLEKIEAALAESDMPDMSGTEHKKELSP